MLTTYIKNTAITQFNRQCNSMTKSIVTNNYCIIIQRTRTTRSIVVGNLRSLNEHYIRQPANFPKHEVTWSRILSNLNKLWVIPKLPGLMRMNETYIRFT